VWPGSFFIADSSPQISGQKNILEKRLRQIAAAKEQRKFGCVGLKLER
jgi:hypothetical protein